jgi:hypothetical protein
MKRVKRVLSEVSAATYVTDNDDTTDPDSPLSAASNKAPATMNVSGPWIRCTNQPPEELLNLLKGRQAISMYHPPCSAKHRGSAR